MRLRLWSSLTGENGNHGGFPERQRPEGRITLPAATSVKRISCPGSPIVAVLHPLDQGLYQVFLEAVAVVVPPDVACPEVGIVVPGVAGPAVVFPVAVAAVVSGVAGPAAVSLVAVAAV